MDHDPSFVHELQRLVCNFIQDTLPKIKHIEDCGDGCASLMNLSNYGNEFGFDALWSFIATSHGPLLCNVNGGTVKKKIA